MINLKLATYRAPRGALFNDAGELELRLPPQPRVQRLAFDIDPPITDPEGWRLVFGMRAASQGALKASLLRGDIGFPDIRVMTAQGTGFRFRRGNIKDFFDIQRPWDRQEVRLPLSTFIYDTDLKKNVVGDSPLAESRIVKFEFDFLSDDEGEICLVLDNPALESVVDDTAVTLDAFDLVNFRSEAKYYEYPDLLFLLNSSKFSIGLKEIAKSLHHSGLLARLTVTSPEGDKTIIEQHLQDAAKSVEFRTEIVGVYSIQLELLAGDGTRYVAETTAVRALTPISPAAAARSIIGISDSRGFERGSALGCRFQRRPMTTPFSIFNDPHGNLIFRHSPALDLLPRVVNSRTDFIVSYKKTPRTLARDTLYDFSRRPPRDWDEYRRFMGYFARHVRQNGGTYLEVWNEASSIYEWAGTMEELIKLHQVSYAAIKEAAPDLKVLGCGTHTLDMNFIQAFMEGGGAEFCDGLNLHGYTYQPGEWADELQTLMEYLEGWEKRNGRSAPDVYFTETGFRTPTFSEQDQADLLTYFSALCAQYPRIRSYLWFRLENQNPEQAGRYTQDMSRGYAMVGYEGRYVRPSLGAFLFLNRILSCGTPLGIRDTENGETALSFECCGEEIDIFYDPARQVPLLDEGAEKYYTALGQAITSEQTLDAKLVIRMTPLTYKKIATYGDQSPTPFR